MTRSDRRTAVFVVLAVLAMLLVVGLVSVGYSSGRADADAKLRHVQEQVTQLKGDLEVLDEEVTGLRNQQTRLDQDMRNLLE